MSVPQRPASAFGGLLQGLVFACLASLNLLLIVRLAGASITGDYALLAIAVFLMCALGFQRFDFIQRWELGRTRSMGTRVFIGWYLLAAVLIVLGYATQRIEEYGYGVMLVWLAGTPWVFLLAHIVARHGLRRLFPGLARSRSAVVVFVNASATSLVDALFRLDTPRYELLGFFEDRSPARTGGLDDRLALLGGLAQLPDYVKARGVDVVFLVLPTHGSQRLLAALEPLGDTTASIYYVPDFQLPGLARMRFTDIGGVPALTVAETPFYGVDGWLKRAMDIAFALVVLLLLSPLFALVALAIRVTMGAPVFFTQGRYGLDGREIRVLKFRTMRVREDGARLKQVERGDPRITPLGGFLRRMSIDEWPQFWNVLAGDMSVIGPRPHATIHNEQYRRLIRRYMVRHKVKPGLTGWAQVHGLRGETRDLADMERRVAYDLDYIEHWSPELDVRIALRTLWIIFRDHEAF